MSPCLDIKSEMSVRRLLDRLAHELDRLVQEEDAQDLIEYAFLAAALALATYSVLTGLGSGVDSQYDNIAKKITGGGRGRGRGT